MKLDLLTNSTVVDDAIRFSTKKQQSNEELKLSTTFNEGNNKESKREGEQEIREITTNKVF
jgi:hypothetical protein